MSVLAIPYHTLSSAPPRKPDIPLTAQLCAETRNRKPPPNAPPPPSKRPPASSPWPPPFSVCLRGSKKVLSFLTPLRSPTLPPDLTSRRLLAYHRRQQLNRAFGQDFPPSVQPQCRMLKSCQNSYQERWRGRPFEASATGVVGIKSRSAAGANSGGVDTPADETLRITSRSPLPTVHTKRAFLCPKSIPQTNPQNRPGPAA